MGEWGKEYRKLRSDVRASLGELVVVDITNPESFEFAKNRLKDFNLSPSSENPKVRILALNKCESGFGRSLTRAVSLDEVTKFVNENYPEVSIVEVSALDSTNVEYLFLELAGQIYTAVCKPKLSASNKKVEESDPVNGVITKLIDMLEAYKRVRAAGPEYKTHFFGKSCGYSLEQKTNATSDLITFLRALQSKQKLTPPIDLMAQMGVYCNGELKSCIKTVIREIGFTRVSDFITALSSGDPTLLHEKIQTNDGAPPALPRTRR